MFNWRLTVKLLVVGTLLLAGCIMPLALDQTSRVVVATW